MIHTFGRSILWQAPARGETLEKLVDLAERNGPVTIYAQKTGIVFIVAVRFASIMNRKRRPYLSLWLTRKVERPRLRRTEVYNPNSYGHPFRPHGLADKDNLLVSLIDKAHKVGSQEHLER